MILEQKYSLFILLLHVIRKICSQQCRDVRTREVGIQEIHHKVRPYEVCVNCTLVRCTISGVHQVELIRRDYVANGGWETFLSYEDPEQGSTDELHVCI